MPRAQIGLPQIIQLLFSASFIGTSAYLSYTLNECSCNHGRIFVPNQIVMIMGVLGVAFTLCNCCFDINQIPLPYPPLREFRPPKIHHRQIYKLIF